MEVISAFLELDCLNMAPIIASSGGTFDPAFRRQKIMEEIERGAVFLSVCRAGKVVAYLEYMPETDNTWYVISTQPYHCPSICI